MYVMYYMSMFRCCQLIRILVRNNHHCLSVRHHNLQIPLPFLFSFLYFLSLFPSLPLFLSPYFRLLLCSRHSFLPYPYSRLSLFFSRPVQRRAIAVQAVWRVRRLWRRGSVEHLHGGVTSTGLHGAAAPTARAGARSLRRVAGRCATSGNGG
jgi:hypothetical protein